LIQHERGEIGISVFYARRKGCWSAEPSSSLRVLRSTLSERRIRAAEGRVVASYGDLARIYDGEYGRMAADIDLYLRALGDERRRGPVLELGCGTGRIALPLVLAGHRVTGVDVSEAMLRRARVRRKALDPEVAIRLRFSRQDMRSFRFPRRFEAAVVAFSTFNLLPNPVDRGDCLGRLAASLAPGAPLILDLASPEPRAVASLATRIVSQFQLPPFGHIVDKMVEERPDEERSVLRVRYDYRVRRWSDDREVDRITVEFDLAPIARTTIEHALYEAGFDVECVEGDYRGSPYRPGSARLVVRARRLAD